MIASARLLSRARPRADEVPRAPRRVPPAAVVREHLFPMVTGFSWMLIGAVALAVARSEGLPPPERSNLGAGVGWLIGVSLVVAGAAVLSWALVRSTWWSRLQRHGRAVDAVVTGVHPVSWVRIGGREPVDLDLRFDDGEGRPCECRVRARLPRRWGEIEVGDRLVLIHPTRRPEQAVLYWRR